MSDLANLLSESNEELQKRWRLILGKDAAAEAQTNFQLSKEERVIDQSLEKLYHNKKRRGGLKNSHPKLVNWLGDIRKYFPKSVVQMMQKDAMDRLGIKSLIMEKELLESFTPDVHLVSILLSLKKVMPEKTRDTAKEVVGKVVKEIEKKLKQILIQTVKGSLNRSVRNFRPRLTEVDWQRTVRQNIKNYQPNLKKIIPEQVYGIGRRGNGLKTIILCVDQSASMASSLVYAGIFGCVLATIPALKTHMIVFDTNVINLTDHLEDPVDLLFSTQLGGGTDINTALGYTQKLITKPEESTLILISDLYEGGNKIQMLKKAYKIRESGVKMIVLLALDDEGIPAYDYDIAQQLQAMDIPCFACTPDQFPNLIVSAIEN